MDRLQDSLVVVSTALAGVCAWVARRLWGRIDSIESRVDDLYKDRLKKADLDKIIDIQHLILQNLLSKQIDKK